jgi:hypothetical protein
MYGSSNYLPINHLSPPPPLPIYLYMVPTSYKMGYQGETRYQLKLKFIHNWVTMVIQWMVWWWVLWKELSSGFQPAIAPTSPFIVVQWLTWTKSVHWLLFKGGAVGRCMATLDEWVWPVAGGHPHALSLEGQRGWGEENGWFCFPTNPSTWAFSFSKWETTNVPTINKVRWGEPFSIIPKETWGTLK